MMKAAFFSYDLEKTVWDQDSGTNLPFFFLFLCCVFTHSVTWSTWIHSCHSLQISYSSPLAPSENSMSVCSVPQSCLTVWPHVLFCSWNSPGKSNGVGCHFLLQGLLPTQVLTRVVWGLGIRTGLQPQQRVQTRKPRQKNSPRNWAVIEIEIFKKQLLPKYMSNTDLDQWAFDPWMEFEHTQTAECPAIQAPALDMATHVQLCPHGSSETLGY